MDQPNSSDEAPAQNDAKVDVYIALIDHTDTETQALSPEALSRHADIDVDRTIELLDTLIDIGMVEEQDNEYRPLIRFQNTTTGGDTA